MMTPRERVLRCLNHERTERVPLNGSFRPEIWEKLKKHFGTNSTEAITEALGFDFKGVGMGLAEDFARRAVSTSWGAAIPHDDGTYLTEWGVRIAFGESSPYARYVYCPLADESNLDSYKFPPLDAPGQWEGIEERARHLKEKYVVSGGVSTFFRHAWDLCGLENWLAHLASPGPFVTKLLDRLLEYKLEQTRRLASAGIDIFSVGGDIAMHTRLFMRPEVWREHFKWRDALLIEEAKKYGVKHFFFHTDGNLMEVMEDLIEIGFTIFDPIQPECMDPYEVKERWGDKITLHGTISSQRTLPFGTVEDVRREVRERIERCGVNGGLVIAPNNVVQYDVPLENLLAVYETAKEVRAEG
jgi:uroporphyrinogen decarboxylase